MHLSTDLSFRRSTYSNPQNCVEIAAVPGGDAAVRDSMNPERGHSAIPGAEWTAFLDAVKSKEL